MYCAQCILGGNGKGAVYDLLNEPPALLRSRHGLFHPQPLDAAAEALEEHDGELAGLAARDRAARAWVAAHQCSGIIKSRVLGDRRILRISGGLWKDPIILPGLPLPLGSPSGYLRTSRDLP